MQTEKLIEFTLKGLLATATEKMCVLGLVDAQEDLKQIRDMYVELVRFWTLDEHLIEEFDEQIVRLNVNHNVLILRRLAAETDENTEVILPDDIKPGTYKVRDVLQYIADMLE